MRVLGVHSVSVCQLHTFVVGGAFELAAAAAAADTVIGRSGINLDGEGAVLFSICNEKAVYYDPENWLKARR